MLENPIMREIWRDLSRGTRRLFRNNVGTGWAGGVQKGSADNVGWETVEIEITPAMVGRKIRWAVFLCIESKRSRGGRLEPDQRTWLEQVRQAGGIAVVARSSEEARAAVEAERAALLRFATGPS
jgi:hypothetical protein